MRTWLYAVSVAALSAATTHACAQQTSAPSTGPDASTGTTEVIVTAHAGNANSGTAAKTIVKREDLTRYGDTTLGDALKRVAGVSVDRDGNIGLRGLGSGYTQVLINGEKAPPDFSLASLSPDSIDRIEITKTPTADMRGDAIAGTINIILRKAAHERQRQLKFSTGQSMGRGQGRPEQVASGTLSNRGAHLAYDVSFSLSHGDSVRTNVEAATDSDADGHVVAVNTTRELHHNRDDSASLTPNLTLTDEAGATTSFQGFLQTGRLLIYRGQTSRASLGTPLPYADNPQIIDYRNHLERLDIDHSRKLGDKASLKLKLSASRYHRGGMVNQTGHDSTGDLILDDQIRSTADQQSISTSGAVSWQVSSRHKLDMGWDGGSDWRSERRAEVNKPLPGAIAGNSDNLFLSQIRRAAVYVQDNWTIDDSWSLYLGLRDEQMDTSSRGTTYDRLHNHISAISPIVQALWKPGGTARDSLRLAVGRTFRAPEIASLVSRPYMSYNNTVFFPDSVGNPALRPELAWGLDLGYEHDWKDGSMVSVSAFQRDLTGVIMTATILRNGRWIATPINNGSARAAGVTIEGRTTMMGMDLHASLSKSTSKVASLSGPGNVLADQPPTQGNFDIDRKVGTLWTFGGSYAFSQGIYAQQTSRQWTKFPDSHEIDLYALRTLTPHMGLRFSVNDLLHQPYRSSSLYIDSTARHANLSLAPSAAEVRVALEFKA